MSSFAQTGKGKILITAASDLTFPSMKMKFEYDRENISDWQSTEFNLTPSLGYIIIDNLALGLSLNFESYKDSNDDYDYKTNSFMVEPVARYYVGTDNIKPYIQGDILFKYSFVLYL